MDDDDTQIYTGDTKTQNSETKDADERNLLNDDYSDDMFSDEEKIESQIFGTPELPRTETKHDDCESAIESNQTEFSPGKPFIPHTPLSLAPLISKCNQTWTSDMETPNTDGPKHAAAITPVDSLISRVKEQITSPVGEDISVSSPVFVTKRRRPKRRIFISTDKNNSELVTEHLDQSYTNSSANTSNSTETVKAINNTMDNILQTANVHLDNIPENDNICQEKCDPPIDTTIEDTVPVEHILQQNVDMSQSKDTQTESYLLTNENRPETVKEPPNNKNLLSKDLRTIEKPMSNISVVPDPMNTSSQDFFNNASFTMIDQICQNHHVNIENGKKTEEEKIEPNTIELLRSCREKLKSNRYSTDLECDDKHLLMQIVNESAEQELLIIQPKSSRKCLKKMPSGITATELFNIVAEVNNEAEILDSIPAPTSIVTGEINKKKKGEQTTDHKSESPNVNMIGVETQMIADCDLAEFMEDWSGNGSKQEKLNTKENLSDKIYDSNNKNALATSFTTGNGVNILIDKESLLKAKRMYEEISQKFPISDEKLDQEVLNSTNLTPVNSSHAAEMNKSTQNELLPQSSFRKESLSTKMGSKYQRIENKENENKNDSPTKIISGFTTADGSNIYFSKDALMTAKKLHVEILEPANEKGKDSSLSINVANSYENKGNLIHEKTIYEQTITKLEKTVRSGFKTANGGNIFIDKDKLEMAKRTFDQEILKTETTADKNDVNEVNLKRDRKSLKLETITHKVETEIKTAFVTNNPKKNNVPSTNENKLCDLKELFDKTLDFSEDFENIEYPIKNKISKTVNSSEHTTFENCSIKTGNSQNLSSNSQITKLRQSLKRKWFSDNDISCHSSKQRFSNSPPFSEQSISKMNRKKMKSDISENKYPKTNLKKSISVDNCFDLATDSFMSNLNIADLFEHATEENFRTNKIARFDSYSTVSTKVNVVKSPKSVSLPEANLRKQAIRNSTNLARSKTDLEKDLKIQKCLGFSREEIAESETAYCKLTLFLQRYLSTSSESIIINTNLSSVASSQLQIKHSFDKNEIYFTEPSSNDVSLSDNLKSSFELETNQVPSGDFYDNYQKKAFLSGANVLKKSAKNSENIADSSIPPLLGFSPIKDHPVAMLSEIIENLNKTMNINKETSLSQRSMIDSPIFDYSPKFREDKSNNKPLSLKRLKSNYSLDKNDKKLYQPSASDFNTSTIRPKETSDNMINNTPYHSGFKTANGQTIKISEESLKKVKKLLSLNEDDISSTSIESERQNDSEIYNTTPFLGGFKTANGRAIKVSEESLQKIKKLLALNEEDIQSTSIESISNTTPSTGGFKTASGKHIQISEESLKKAKKLFSLDEDDFKTPEVKLDKINSHEVFNAIPSEGFKTASGQTIKISEESLKKAKKLLSLNEDNIGSGPIENEKLNIHENSCTTPSLGGFKTADGQDIQISKESLQKAKKLLAFNEDEIESPAVKSEKLPIAEISYTTPSSREFKAAEGRGIGFFKNGLDRVKKLLTLDESNSDPLQSKSTKATEVTDNMHTPLGRLTVLRAKANTAPNLLTRKSSLSVDLGNSVSISAKKLFSDTTSDSSFSSANNSTHFSTKRKFNELYADDISLNSSETLCKQRRNSTEIQIRTTVSNENNKEDQTVAKNLETESSAVENIPTSPIIGNRRRKQRIKHRRDQNISENKKEDNINKEEEKVDLLKRFSLPAKLETEPKIEVDAPIGYEISDNVEEDRFAAVLLQDKLINMKKRNKPKAVMGSLYSYRIKNGNRRLSWKNISNGKAPQPKTIEEIKQENLDPKILEITASNAVSYGFHVSNIIGKNVNAKSVISVNLSDNIRLLINENGYATKTEFERAFLASSNVDPALIPAGWIDNHYGFIVWKLASIDRKKFDNFILPRYAELKKALTVNRVMEELKYRYDREIDRAQRSALRTILEKDEVASKRLILCISKISQVTETTNQEKDKSLIHNSEMYNIEVTDGWYTIPITIDIPMLHYIKMGKIKEGTKIVTSGAELLNCERGCHPLEKSNNISLKIHTNSTRRARWDAKLGYQRNPEPFPLKLQNIDSNGGTVGKLSVVISRIFPTLYKEKMPDGQTIYRNARCEEKAAANYERDCQNRIEELYAKAEKNYQSIADSQEESQSDWDNNELIRRREEFKQKLEREVRANLPARRIVTPVLKIRVANKDTSALVTIWSSNDNVSNSLKEGSCVSIYNASAAGRRGGELHLSFNSSSFFKPEPTMSISYPARTYTSILSLQNPTFDIPYGEFDTVGIVVSITNAPRGMKNFEVVNLAYPVDDKISKYLSIYFWQGVSTSGYSSILTKGSLVACNNLEWRRSSSLSIPAGYYNEKTAFSCNPRQTHLQEPFEHLRKTVKNKMFYAMHCAEEVAQEFEKMSTMKNVSNPGTPSDKSFYSNSPQTSAMLNSSGVHTPVRSSIIQKKLEMLTRYGEAPALSPIVTHSSSRVKSEFIPLKSTPKSK